MKIQFVIDAGHGGTTQVGRSTWGGAQGTGGTLEKDVTFSLAQRVVSHLGGRATLTRAADINSGLADRAAVARAHGATAFVSLHANSGDPSLRGAELYVHSNAGLHSRRLAKTLGAALTRGQHPIALPRVQAGPLSVLDPRYHLPATAACLLEVDYLTHPEGERQLRDPRYLDQLGRSIAYGLREYTATPTATALAAAVPWSGTFAIKIRLPSSRIFSVTRGAVTVEASATWSGYRTIPLASDFSITLWRNVDWGSDDDKGSVSFPTNGTTASSTWKDLSNADYYLEIYVGNTDPSYTLNGTVSVT
jgi:N-acetylmuramoyl-L-alanine amidase